MTLTPSPTLSAKDVAKYFIYRAQISSQEGKAKTYSVINNLKLNKILYYAQGFNLALNNKPLFDEKIEAWIHGPVIPSIYASYKKFGRDQITNKIDKQILQNFTEATLAYLDEIWSVFGKYDGKALENSTHNEDPWINARGSLEVYETGSNEITHEDMKSYFKKSLESSNA